MIARLYTFLFLLFASTGVEAITLLTDDSSQRQSYAESPGAIELDPSWQPFSTFIKNDDARFWFYLKFTVKHDPGEIVRNPLALSVRLNGVYDFYWDDVLIGSNKDQGDAASQYSRVLIPVSGLSEGEHHLKIHIAALGLMAGESSDLRIQIAANRSNFFGVHSTVVSTFFIATAALFLAGYLIVTLRTGGRRKGTITAILLCVTIAIAVLLDEARYLFEYPYSLQPYLNALQPPFAISFFILLPWLIFTRINVSKRLWWMVVTPVSLAASLFEVGAIEQYIRAFFISNIALLGIALLGWHRGYINAKIFSIGLGVALFALLLDLEKGHLFLAVILLLVAFDLALDIRRQNKEAVRLQIMSERLRADLIKRNVQPHFLMNSLTALMEWVETSPDDAVNFIDGLAQEFRILADFSDRRSVSLREELELCNIHVDLMGRRLDSCITLETSDVNPEQRVPPALFHTLIENAFSHNDYRGIEATFTLTQKTTNDGDMFCLSVPVVGARESNQNAGLGTRYIEARLEEFCGNTFRFQSQMIDSFWVSEITFKKV